MNERQERLDKQESKKLGRADFRPTETDHKQAYIGGLLREIGHYLIQNDLSLEDAIAELEAGANGLDF